MRNKSRPPCFLRVALLLSLSALVACGGYVLRNEPYRQEVLELVAAQPSEHLVDIGCQDGFWSYALAPEVGSGGTVYAIDIESDWVEHVRRQSEERGLTQIQAVRCPPDDTTLEDESVDVIFFANTIHHIDDITAYTEHLYRILKPGGRYVVIDSSKGRGGHHSSPEEISRISADVGFVVKESKRFDGTRRYLIVFSKPGG
jgi:ubiquinone/menaquinone biosynthesis C-methylase UbiE